MVLQRQHWLWLIPILLLTVVLSAPHLNEDAIWFDEWITYFISGTGQFDVPQVANTPCADIPGTEFSPIAMLCVTAIDNSWPPAFFSLHKFGSQSPPFGNYFRAIDRFIEGGFRSN